MGCVKKKRKKYSVLVALILASAITLLFSAVAFGEEESDEELGRLIAESGISDTADKLSQGTRELMEELGMDELSLRAVMELSPGSFFRLTFRLAKDRLVRPAKNAALFGTAQVGGQHASGIVKPLAGAFTALALVGVAVPSFGLSEIAGSVKKAVVWSLGAVTTLFVAILGSQSGVAAAADGVAMKAARFAVSSTVPVVGGALSDAMDSAVGYLRLLKNVIGAFGIGAGAAIFLPVMVDLILWRVALGVAVIFAQIAGVPNISKASSAFSDVLEILLALALCVLLMVIVTVGILLASGN